MLRTVALILLGLCFAGSAGAYTPSQCEDYSYGGATVNVCGSTTLARQTAACANSTIYLAIRPTATVGEHWAPSGHCYAYDVYPTGPYSGVILTNSGLATTCPNGGTLTGGTCVCGPGETDTGSACEAPSCPADQWHNGTACVAKCPAAGTAWAADDHASTFLNTGINFPRGRSTACMPKEYGAPSSGFSASCEVENTSMVQVCDDDGCWGEFARHTGRMCSATPPAPADVPALADPTPTTCESGDLWCVSETGSCGSGFTTGTVNGTTICAATGQTIGITPQPQSPNSPPPSTNLQPNSWSSPSARTGESINSSSRVVVSVGPGATQWPGTPGGGGDGEGDGECGLTDSTKCKIDETGTPNGSGVSDQQSGVNAGAESLGDALEGVTDGTTKPNNIGWGITSIMFPTNCSPFVIGPFGSWGSYTIDFCQFQPIVHDLMSMVWASFGLIFSVGMVFRTVTTGGA